MELKNEIKKYLKNIPPDETILIPICETQVIYEESTEFFENVSIYKNEAIKAEKTLKAGEIYNPKKIISTFGEFETRNINIFDYEYIINQYKNLLKYADRKKIYAISGWLDKRSYLLGNLLITAEK